MNSLLKYLPVVLLLLLSNHLRASNIHIGENDSISVDTQNVKSTDRYKAIGGNIFLGYGMLDGNISDYITNPVFIGINIEFHRQRLVIQIDDYSMLSLPYFIFIQLRQRHIKESG